MHLREHLWRKRLRLKRHRLLPKMYQRYDRTPTWAAQLNVLDNDLARMPHMNRGNVIKLVQRHAATVPWHPYTQGHLYLIQTMAYVLHDESSLFWGYTRICQQLHPYGPDTQWGSRVIPDWVYGAISDKMDVCRDLFDVVIRFRWIYILFGQTFTTPSAICTVWDYALSGTGCIHRLCHALLTYAAEREDQNDMCAVQRLSLMASIQIETDTDAAEIIARAQAIKVR